MKRLFSLLLALALVLSLTACAADEAQPTDGANTPSIEAPTEEVTEPETEAPTEPVLRGPVENPGTDEPLPEWEETDVPADAEKAAMGEDILVPDAMKDDLQSPVDPYRPHYDLGTAGTFVGDTYTLMLFLSDNESTWYQSDVDSFIQNNYFPAETWLRQQAANWNVTLNVTSGYYLANSRNENIRYNGIIGDFNTECCPDILEQAAQSVGYESARAMHEGIKNYAGVENISFVIVVNKPGRSYASMDWNNDGYEYIEYCVVFAQPLYTDQGVYLGDAATIAHEMLHLYGAEDFYAEGDLRNGRARLAGAYYSNGIMYTQYTNINYNIVDHYTAYTVGWTHSTPNVCYDPNWWN